MLFHSPTAVICYLVGLSLVFAGRVNVTIDDTYGDEHTGLPIAYTPTDYWKAGQDCTDCTARPDATRAHESTWRDGTFNLNNTEGTDIPVLQASVPFDGVAVYVYCILTGTYSSPDSYSQLNFVIDGETVGEFMHQPNGDGTYYYNVPVYVNESIPAGTHSLQIVNGQAGGKKSLVLLDYIVYTRDVTTATPNFAPSSPQLISSSLQPISNSLQPIHISSQQAASSLPSVTAPAAPPTVSLSVVQATAAAAAATTTTAVAAPSPSSSLPQAPVEHDGGTNTHSSTVLVACLAAIFGSLVLCALAGWTIWYIRRWRRQRVAPSTAWLRSAAAQEEMMAGASAGPDIATPEKLGGIRWTGGGGGPDSPVSVNTLAPLRPNSAGTTGDSAQRAAHDARDGFGIEEVSRTKAGWR